MCVADATMVIMTGSLPQPPIAKGTAWVKHPILSQPRGQRGGKSFLFFHLETFGLLIAWRLLLGHCFRWIRLESDYSGFSSDFSHGN